MKNIYNWLLAIVISFPLAIQAGVVTINTEDSEGSYELKFSEYTEALVSPDGSITINGTEYLSGTLPVFSGGVSCGEGTQYDSTGNQCVVAGQSSSSSSSSSSTPPACGTTPSNVIFSNMPALSTFGKDTGTIEFEMPRSPRVYTHLVSIPSGANGQINLGGMSWTSLHMRSIWFSECPGGEAVSKCFGTSILGTMRWATYSSRGIACKLEPNKDYFLNLSSPSCTSNSGCDAIIHHMGGWK